MKVHVYTPALCAVIAAAMAAVCGCRSGDDTRRRIRDEVAELRAGRDREVADMRGQPVPPKKPPKRATPPPKDLRPAPRIEKVPEAVKRKRPQPAWVRTGFAQAYPAEQYIVGVGSCRRAAAADHESLVVAEDRARDSVARNIRVRVTSEYQSAAKLITEMTSGKARVKRDTTRLNNTITSSADEVLEGAAIVDRWYDTKEKAYWILAALDRAVAADNIVARVKRLRRDGAGDHALARSFREQGRPFPALSRYNRARNAAVDIMAYRVQLRIISPPHARDLGPPANNAALWQEAALAARALRFGVVAFEEKDGRSSPSKRHASALTAALRRLGLEPVKIPPPPPHAAGYAALRQLSVPRQREWVGERADCLLLASLESEDVRSATLGETVIHFSRGRGEAVVVDLVEGKVVADASFGYLPQTHTGNREQRHAADEAMTKAASELARRIERQLAAALNAGGQGPTKRE